MSQWSEQAQAKAPTGDQKAGDPVRRCVEGTVLEPFVDAVEPVVVDSEVGSEPLPRLDAELEVSSAPSVLDTETTVHDRKG